MLLVHSGNRIDLTGRAAPRFPPAQVPAVRARLAKVLEGLAPSDVVSAAAAGADLIVLEECIRRGIHVHIVLPIAAAQFIDTSVADAGADWVERFHAVLRHTTVDAGSSVLTGDDEPTDDWYVAAHDQLLDRATAIAAGRRVVALTVRPPRGEVPPSVTDEFASRAARLDLLVLTVDPRPGAADTVIVG